MRALTVVPGLAGSARLDDLPEPTGRADELLVADIAVGVCGTDREIVAGAYGWPPPGRDRLSSATDVVVECTGVGHLVFDVLTCTAPAGIVCLTGVSAGGRQLRVDAGALNRELVLQNDVVFGSVNANAGHYCDAVEALTRADPDWLSRLITPTRPAARLALGTPAPGRRCQGRRRPRPVATGAVVRPPAGARDTYGLATSGRRIQLPAVS